MSTNAKWAAEVSDCFACAEGNINNMMCNGNNKLPRDHDVVCCSPVLDDMNRLCKETNTNICTQPLKTYTDKNMKSLWYA